MTETRLPLHSCSYTEDVFNLLGKRWTGPSSTFFSSALPASVNCTPRSRLCPSAC
ncbi:hypothetical protein [Streptomyces mirabilis]|uniref:hypothetical protein n=1 Tax=Streptomyces mirabilis TaxID=68239 RepID=UPI003447BD55